MSRKFTKAKKGKTTDTYSRAAFEHAIVTMKYYAGNRCHKFRPGEEPNVFVFLDMCLNRAESDTVTATTTGVLISP